MTRLTQDVIRRALAQATDGQIASEWGKRRVAKRATHAGPAKVLRPRAKCGQKMGARELRVHLPGCTAN